MKILLVNLPRFTDGAPLAREECALGPCFASPIPNLLMNVGAALSGAAETHLFDAAALNLGFDAVAREIDKNKPDAVVCAILNYTISYDKQIAKICTEKNIPCIAVPMPFGYGKKVAESANYHFVAAGDPEKTILDWARGESLETLPGAIRRAGGETIENPAQQPYFDDLPGFDWRLLSRLDLYGWRLYQVSRNCKWGCRFCMWAGGAPRHKTVDVVLEDLRHLKKHTRGNIGLLTASITQNREWFDQFITRAPALKIRFSTDIRADETTPDDLRALKRAGCSEVLIGVESFNQRLLDAMNKRETVERNIEIIRQCNKIGLPTTATLIFNIGETENDIDEYIRATGKCRPTHISPVIYKCLEGTKPIPSAGPIIQKIFWGTDPVGTPEDIDAAIARIARFKKATRTLRLRTLLWFLRRPGLWPALAELISLKIKS